MRGDGVGQVAYLPFDVPKGAVSQRTGRRYCPQSLCGLLLFPRGGWIMFHKFKYEPLPLGDISLDDKNPRIVSQEPLTNQDAILSYLFEHEDLLGFIKRIAHNGKNKGAERPYVIKKGTKYTVVEGNTRIASYKVLAGQLKPPSAYESQIPSVSDDLKSSLLVVDCAIAPSRDAMLPIMAESHFGVGDKSKWGYLGSRKALFDEHAAGRTIPQLARAFGLSQSDVTEFMLDYQLYLEALNLSWTAGEKAKLLDPRVAFNPPVRFLQTKGHRELTGINYDRPNLKIVFDGPEAKNKFKHLIRKLVVSPQAGLGATALYLDVFKDYEPLTPPAPPPPPPPTPSPPPAPPAPPSPPPPGGPHLKAGALFNYPVSLHNNLVKQLMKEAADINAKKLPASATFLIRNLLEAILKHIIDQSGANPTKASLGLEQAISICKGKNVPLGMDDKKVLKEFENQHLDYVNLGAHGNLVPHPDRVFQIRNTLDQFIKKNV